MATTCSRERLLSLLDACASQRVLVIGDVILDRYLWGKVERISPEAPVPVVTVTRSEDRLGGATNAVRNAKNLGGQVSLCGVVGDDIDGERVRELLGELGVASDGLVTDSLSLTIVKTRVMAASQHHSQQVVRIDQEETGFHRDVLSQKMAAYVRDAVREHDAVLLSDYGKGAVSAAVLGELSKLRQGGELGLQRRPYLVDPHPVNSETYAGITLATPNRFEAERSSGKSITSVASACEAARVLQAKWSAELMVITLSEEGMVVVGPSESDEVHLPTEAQEVYDVSGAGDTVIAVMTLALAAGASPGEAGMLANIAAGIVVSEVGTVAIGQEVLRERIRSIENLQ